MGTTLRSPLKDNRSFGRTCRLHLQGQRKIHVGKRRENKWQEELPGLSISLFFEPEDGGDMFLRNVRCFSTDCTGLYPEETELFNPLLYHLLSVESLFTTQSNRLRAFK
jgi:hypothetical protein